MLLRCNMCVDRLHDNASNRTDLLYMREINGVDYLVCKFHLEDGYEQRQQIGKGLVSRDIQGTTAPSESALSD